MSSKTSIILTEENEHWYSDCSEPLVDKNGNRVDVITLEFDKDNIRIDCNDNHDLVITITNPDCELMRIMHWVLGKLLRAENEENRNTKPPAGMSSGR